MCGRYSLPIDPESLPEWFERQNLEVDSIEACEKRTNKKYNIAPTACVPVFMKSAPSVKKEEEEAGEEEKEGEEGEKDDKAEKSTKAHGSIEYMRWGLVPSWFKSQEDLKRHGYTTFNARLENLKSNKTWKSNLNHRCVIPMIGYYEWTEDKKKTPYFIKRKDGELMFMAGLYNHAKIDKSEDKFGSFTIITRPAPESLSWLHHRIPVMLDPKDPEFLQWLNQDENIDDILKDYQHLSDLEWFKVDPAVGDVKNDKKSFILPQKDTIGSFFNKKQKTH